MRYSSIIIALTLLIPVPTLASDCVILLHGLARSDSSMHTMEKALNEAGFHAVNVKYPSRKYPIEKLANYVIPQALKACEDSVRINFVTHSLGGILVRQYLNQHEIRRLNHVVMLGPPNQGSEVVDTFAKVPGFKLLNGPAGLQLGTNRMSVPKQLGAANFSLGVIAGTRTINHILSAVLPKPNDGKVSVESTKLDGMKDHLVLPVTHPFMMKNKAVIKQVIYFLNHGKFEDLES